MFVKTIHIWIKGLQLYCLIFVQALFWFILYFVFWGHFVFVSARKEGLCWHSQACCPDWRCVFRENAVKGENSLDGDYFLAEVRGDFVNNVEQYKYNMIIIFWGPFYFD